MYVTYLCHHLMTPGKLILQPMTLSDFSKDLRLDLTYVLLYLSLGLSGMTVVHSGRRCEPPSPEGRPVGRTEDNKTGRNTVQVDGSAETKVVVEVGRIGWTVSR